jgi:hypothetical protein
MANPYQSPLSEQFYNQARQQLAGERQQALAAVQGPGIALMIVGGISVAACSMSALFNIGLLASGAAANFDRNGMDPYAVVIVRLCWGLAILAASAYCIFGGWQMKNLTSFTHAWIASIVAVIPCLGPCCVLGIPFGAWAIAVLMRPEVQSRFES